jgi:hypothetical protein
MNTRLRLAGLILGIIILASLLAPWLAVDDPRQAAPEIQFQSPSARHPFGTDLLGRDVYSRVLYGGRRMLGMALLAMAVTLPPGLLIGLVAGYAGRWIDRALMTLMDALLAFPALLLALALITWLGSGLPQIALAVGIAGIPPYARVTRAAVLEARTLPFVEAARAVGARPGLSAAGLCGGNAQLGAAQHRRADLSRLWRRYFRAGLGRDAGRRAAYLPNRSLDRARPRSGPQPDRVCDQSASQQQIAIKCRLMRYERVTPGQNTGSTFS